MEITTITRTISGNNFDNIAATANVGKNENPIETAKVLDSILKNMLSAIKSKEETVREISAEKNRTVSMLEQAIAYVKEKDEGIPF